MKKIIYLLLICFIFFLPSCKKNQEEEIKPSGGDSGITTQDETTYYDVSFIDGDKEITKVSCAEDDIVNFPTVEEKPYYTFLGWSKVKNSIDDIVEVLIPSSDTTLYAVYSFDELQYCYDNFSLPKEADSNIEFPSVDGNVKLTYRSNKQTVLSNWGEVIKRGYDDVKVSVSVTFLLDGKSLQKNFDITVLALTTEEILESLIEKYEFDDDTSTGKLSLKKDFGVSIPLKVVWSSSNPELISDDGVCLKVPSEDTTLTFTLMLSSDGVRKSQTYQVVLRGRNLESIFDDAVSGLKISTYISSPKIRMEYDLPYGIKAKFKSSNESIISADGSVAYTTDYLKYTMMLEVSMEGEEFNKDYEYEFTLSSKPSLVSVDAACFNPANMEDVEIVDGNLILKEGKTSGIYISDPISTMSFYELVPTWQATTSTKATVEFLVQACVNGTWTDYASYCPGGFGLGLQNGGQDVSGTNYKLVDDEFIITAANEATSLRFKLILRRTTDTDASPVVRKVVVTLASNNYSGATYSLSTLPKGVKYDVPKLYQREVPSIGGSICSPTSCTMLLKYKGMDFSSYDTYEHRYIANLFKDYGNNIFGSWCYCCVGMASYGFNAYCCRMYSVEELAWHLANVGPLSISVKGSMVSNVTTYSTGGHLLDIVGYKIEGSNIVFYANDPNVSGVACTYDASVIKSVWRNMTYVIE